VDADFPKRSCSNEKSVWLPLAVMALQPVKRHHRKIEMLLFRLEILRVGIDQLPPAPIGVS
jgi:hypothetical protein